jgi:sulfite oxidase
MPPEKNPALIVRQPSPFNGGPPLSAIIKNFITPNDLFFVRNHGDVPQIDPATYRLTVDGLVNRPLSLSLAEIQSRFPARTVTATLQCAGNRRNELAAVEAIPHELEWGAEAIGTAEWRGAPLSEILQAVGVQGGSHIACVGFDETERRGQRIHFGGSVSLDKATQPEVLLAYEMNGQPLPLIHGFPLRLVVPGYIGARSVKWLNRMTVQAEPSDNYFQSVAYRLFAPHERADTVNMDAGLRLGELSVNAVICEPQADQRCTVGALTIQGYACAGGDRHIARVDVSTDGGQTWQAAQLQTAEERWAWQLWKIEVSLAPGSHQLVVRAVDSAANMMPEDPRSIWNFKGYMNNAWHRVTVHAE